jgi:hypothetical protein
VTARVLYVGCAFLFVIQSSDSRRFYREATEQSGQTSHHVKLPSVSPSLNIMNPQLPSYQFAQEVTRVLQHVPSVIVRLLVRAHHVPSFLIKASFMISYPSVVSLCQASPIASGGGKWAPTAWMRQVSGDCQDKVVNRWQSWLWLVLRTRVASWI